MNHAIILSGGIGSRMKESIPKQYLDYRSRPIITYCMKTFDAHPQIDRIVVVADKCWQGQIERWMREDSVRKLAGFAEPGENRQLSIKSGLMALANVAAEDDAVIIHDAARPLVSAELITRCFEALPGHDGVMPYLSAKDTFYLMDETRRVSDLLPRARLAAGQAPEAFWFDRYFQINCSISDEEIRKINGSTEIALKYGLDVAAIPGEERNIKITTQEDLRLMNCFFEDKER